MPERPDDVVAGRLHIADRGPRADIGRHHDGIRQYIGTIAFNEGTRPAAVPCPPMEQWASPPLPSPTSLRMCSPRTYDNLASCVAGEFEIVRALMSGGTPPPEAGFGESQLPV